MNGRVYDPALGRFLSVDPVFQFPENVQSLNPYTYVLNNPLSLTDPTGEFVVVIPIAIAAYNAFSSAGDIAEASLALQDDTASFTDKALAVGSAAASVLDVTPGDLLKRSAVLMRQAVKGVDGKAAKEAGQAATKVDKPTRTASESGSSNAQGSGDKATDNAAQVGSPTETGKVTPNELRDRGAIEKQRQDVLGRRDGQCQYCGERPSTQVDHIDPVKKGAEAVNAGEMTKDQARQKLNQSDNLAGSCGGKGGCNPTKGANELSATPGPGKFVPKNPDDFIKGKMDSAACSTGSNEIC